MKTTSKRKILMPILASMALYSCGVAKLPEQSESHSSESISIESLNSEKSSEGKEVNSQGEKGTSEIIEPASVTPINILPQIADDSLNVDSRGFFGFVRKLNLFASKLDANLNAYANEEKENSAFSPISMFFALAMLSRISDAQSERSILDILDITKGELETYTAKLYSFCNRVFEENDVTFGKESLTNTLFLEETFPLKSSYASDIANLFYTNAFLCDFKNNPKGVSRYVSEYVNQKTEGLLNPNYSFNSGTVMVLLNTLFFEDAWSEFGHDLRDGRQQNFNNGNGSTSSVPYYYTNPVESGVHHAEKYSSAFAKTYSGFKIDFKLPNDGYTVDDIFTEEMIRGYENVNYVSSTVDDNGIVTRYTSDISLPEFNAEFNGSTADIISRSYGTMPFKMNQDAYDTAEEVLTTDIVHTTKVKFSKESLKGAAATAVIDGSTAPAPLGYKIQHETLVLNKPFAYTIYDPSGIKLFEGVVYNAK